MTSTAFSSPDGTIFNLEEVARGLRLYPAYDGARVELTVRTWASQAPPGVSLRVSATLNAGPQLHHDRRPLGRLTATNLVTANPTPTDLVFTGHFSAQALREVDEMRQGNSLWLTLSELRATGLAGEPAKLTRFTAMDLPIEVLSQEWATQLERVTPSSYVEVLVPVTDDAALATASGRLRTARTHIRGGVFSAVAAELRQALDPVRAAYDTQTVAKAARAKSARERSVPERWALTVEDTYALLSAFIHDEEDAIAGQVLDRALAVNLLADVAGKIHRLAADRRAGQI